jgi:hypothetical protein
MVIQTREVFETFCLIVWPFQFFYDFQNYDNIIFVPSLSISRIQKDLYNECIKSLLSDFEKIPIQSRQRLSFQTL